MEITTLPCHGLLGYMSAYNYFIGSGINILEESLHAESISLWLDNYCSDNPLDSLPIAAHSLIENLKSRLEE